MSEKQKLIITFSIQILFMFNEIYMKDNLIKEFVFITYL